MSTSAAPRVPTVGDVVDFHVGANKPIPATIFHVWGPAMVSLHFFTAGSELLSVSSVDKSQAGGHLPRTWSFRGEG